ncbi:hypothetical protein Q5P01_023235 [Channa striata]|uniref:Uncharacterized protein n=1 Tax=Channa striata TaxID=64152 RepID=A0AA88INU4_CHASR|nr:hypothetical protein Q5P01_023235 [Channa striata]
MYLCDITPEKKNGQFIKQSGEQYSGQEQLSDRLTGQIVGPIASPRGDASPPLYFLPSGLRPEPTSWEHGAERLQPTTLWVMTQ